MGKDSRTGPGAGGDTPGGTGGPQIEDPAAEVPYVTCDRMTKCGNVSHLGVHEVHPSCIDAVPAPAALPEGDSAHIAGFRHDVVAVYLAWEDRSVTQFTDSCDLTQRVEAGDKTLMERRTMAVRLRTIASALAGERT